MSGETKMLPKFFRREKLPWKSHERRTACLICMNENSAGPSQAELLCPFESCFITAKNDKS